MKKFLQTLAIFLVFVVLVGVISNITDAFTSSNEKSFGVIVGEEEYRVDTAELSVTQGETLKIKHYDGDEKIKLKVTAVAVPRDWCFMVGSADGRQGYYWNQQVVRKGADLTQFFDIKIDQEANTITVNGSISDMLTKYYNGSEIAIVQKMPTASMLCFEIKSGDTLKLYCNVYATVSGVMLSGNNVMLY